MDKTSINVGLIGLGEWPKEAYIPVLLELEGVKVAAVSVSSEATQQFARESFGSDIAIYNDYHDLLNDANIQAIFLALPNQLHAEALEAAVKSDKHIFFEPPIGLNKEQIDRALNVIDGSKRVIQTDLELRCLPVMDAIGKLIESGAIGKVLSANLRLWCDWGYGGGKWNQNVEDEGFFLWLSCWYLDVLDAIIPAVPDKVAVVGGYAMNGRLMDHGYVTMNYPGGALGQLEFSLLAVEGTEVTLRIAGTEGEIQANLQSGDYRWRQKDNAWQKQSSPCSQPVCGFVGMRESIINFFDAVGGNGSVKADAAACRRIHQTVLACIEAENKAYKG